MKAFTLEAREEKRFSGECERYYRHNMAVARTSAAFHGAIGLLAGAGVAFVLFLGGRAVAQGTLTLGGFVAFNAYLAMLSFPTMAMGWVINLFQRGSSAMGRINEFLRLPVEFPEGGTEPAGERTISSEDASGSGTGEPPLLEVRGLAFSYGGDERGEALRGVSFSVRKGEVLGLVGPTGGGKSTLFSLLPGLYPAPPGTVFLEGKDASAIPLPELRRHFAVVAQDPFLFSDSMLENVCFGRERSDPEAARKATGLACLPRRGRGDAERVRHRRWRAGDLSLGGAEAASHDRPCALLRRTFPAAGRRPLRRGRRDGAGDLRGDPLGKGGADGPVQHAPDGLPLPMRPDPRAGGRKDRRGGDARRLFSLRGAYFDLYSRQMLARELEESS